MKHSNLLILALLITFLSACAANRYIEPEIGPIASVTYKIKAGSESMQIFVFDSYKCKKPSFISSVISHSDDQYIKINVKADTPLINTFRAHDIFSASFITTEFTPSANQNYLVSIDTSKKSAVRILKDTPDGLQLDFSVVEPKRVCKW